MNPFRPLVLAGTAMLVVLTIFLAVSTNQVLNTAATSNTVSFTGEGKVTAKPDIATVDLSIVTEATTSKGAQDQNSQKSNRVTDFLKGQGIEDKDIKTTSYNIYPQYRYDVRPAGLPQITGYQVTQTVQVKIRNLDTANVILDGVVSAGVNQVSGLNFTVDDIEKLKDEARQKAVKDAKAKAEALEDEIDVDLGKIVNFQENVGGYAPPIYYAKDMATGMGGGGGPSVPSGENEIIISVTITYQIR